MQQRDSKRLAILFLALLGVSLVNAQAFLEKELPLEVSATTPTDLLKNDTTSLRFAGQQTITVVFSRAVIALGSDFGVEELPEELLPFTFSEPAQAPGRFRWVTTSIARWDPINFWPPDVNMDLVWNTNMKSYDGVPVVMNGPERVRITTDPLRVTILGVGSLGALDRTDNHWDAEIGLENELLPEVPPDGSIIVRFSYLVELAALEPVVKVVIFKDEKGTDREETNIGAVVKRCTSLKTHLYAEDGSPLTRDCAVIEVEGAKLQVGTRYALIIPKGTVYNQGAGPLSEEVAVEFYGLREFRIPFLWNMKVKKSKDRIRQQNTRGFVNGLNVSLWLPHGLSDDTSIEDLKSAISLEWFPWKYKFQKKIPMDFDITLIDKGTASISADFKPAEQYKIFVHARDDIRDGYGLPLKQSEVKFPTSSLSGFINAMHVSRRLYFDSSQTWDGVYPIMSRGRSPLDKEIRVLQINPKTLDEARREAWLRFQQYDDDIQYGGTPALKAYFPEKTGLTTTTLELGPARENGGMTIVTMNTADNMYSSREGHWITILDYHVFVSSTLIASKEYEGVVWLVDMKTGAPAEGVEVHVLRWPAEEAEKFEDRKVDHLVTLTTDDKGMATFTTSTCKRYDCRNYALWIKQKASGSVLFHTNEFEDFSTTSYAPTSTEASLTVDRVLVEPGDKIRFIGHVVKQKGVETYAASNEKVELSIRPHLDPDSTDYSMSLDIELDEFGSFVHEVDVGEDPMRQSYSVSLEQGYSTLDRLNFIVGEPRLPTALLEIITPEWVPPGKPFLVEVQATSLLGGNIADAEMTLEYEIDLESGDSIEETATIITNTTGGVAYEIDLAAAEEVVVGDVVRLSVTWIGPTRERLVEEASLRVQQSDKEVELKRLFSSSIPGLEFGVLATVTQVGAEGDLKGLPVEISMFKLPDDLDITDMVTRQLSDVDDYSIPLTKVAGCNVMSGDVNSLADCRLSLPEMGKFALRGCLDDSPAGNGVVCKVLTMGKTLKEWELDPISDNFELETHLVTDEIPYGKPLEFYVDVPLDKYSVLLSWGNELKTNRQVHVFEEKGLQKLSIDIGDACVKKCELRVNLAAARQETPIGAGVPIDYEFDPMGPRKFSQGSKTIQYKDEVRPHTLNVSVIIDGVVPGDGVKPPVTQPGKSVPITISVTKCPGNKSDPKNIACENPVGAGNAKVVVFAVDKSYLEVSGPSLVDLPSALSTNLIDRNYVSREWLPSNDLHAAKVFKLVQDKLKDIMNGDPWALHEATNRYGDVVRSTISRPAEYFSGRQVTPITLGPPGVPSFLGLLGRELQQPSGRVDSGASARSPDEAGPVARGAPAPDLRLETDFEAVPLFEVFQTETDGNGQVEFTPPDNLGTFVVRAYAATDDAKFGGGESEVIVRLPLSLTPSRPKLARVGDEFEAGTIITLSGDQKAGVPVTVSLLGDPDKVSPIREIPQEEPKVVGLDGCDGDDLSCFVTLDEKVITSDVDGQVEVRFRFKAERLGDANITIRADAPGVSDALQMTFPVMGQQDALQVSTSFAIEGTEQANAWEEGLKLPEAVPGSGTIDLRAGVGNLPSVLTTVEDLLDDKPREPYASGALANISLPHILRLYSFQPGMEVYDRAIAAYNEAEHGLNFGNLTSNEYGLLHYLPDDRFRPSTSLGTSSEGVWIVDELTDVSEKVKSYQKVWRERLEKQLVRDAEELRRDKGDFRLFTLSRVRLALGPTWNPPMCPSSGVCAGADTTALFSMSKFTEKIAAGEILHMSVSTRAQVALSWLKHLGQEEGRKHPDVAAILDSFRTSIRTIGRTAYISYRPTSSAKAGMWHQALALLAFVRAGETGPLLEKLVNHVANEDEVSYWLSPTTKVTRMLALAEYDQSRGSSNPDLALTARSGENTLLEAEFRKASDPVVTTSNSFDSLGDDPAPLMFTAQGTGEASLVASLKFIPAKLLPFPSYRGLYVERCVQKAGADGEAKGPCLSGGPLGAQLVITLQITSPDDVGAVIVRALMPGGIEPVDPLTSSDSGARTTCFLDSMNIRFRWWWWPLCPEQETRPAVVTFRYYRLRAGTHTIKFQAISTSVGDWILPPVRAFLEDQPEVLGLSPAGKFKICDGCAAETIPVKNPPIPCPNNCSDSGVCDLTKGACECDPGFTGTDCSQLFQN